MKKKVWIEWIGLWGSGKSTCINNYVKSLEEGGSEFNTTKDFFNQSKFKKIYTFLSSPVIFIASLRLFFLLLPFFIRACLKKDYVVIYVFRSFLTCYLARLNSNNKPIVNNILWEGEMHLLPILNLNRRATNKAIGLLLDISKRRTNAIIVMKIDEDIAFNRVLIDEENGINVRFKKNEEITIERFRKFNSSQELLIEALRGKEIKIFESDGDAQNLKEFIRSI